MPSQPSQPSSTSTYEPGEAIVEFFRLLGEVSGCILTHKNAANRAVNAIGSPCLWRIDRTDLNTEEIIVSTKEFCAGTPDGKEPPFHVHVADWTELHHAEWVDKRLPFHPNVSRRLALVTTTGGEALAWFVPQGEAADRLIKWVESNPLALG
jgi:hypothetical protein